VAGYGFMLRIQDTLNYAAGFLPALILIGISFSVCFPMMTIQATAGVRDQEQGIASGLGQTSIQFGAAIVVAAVTAIVSSDRSGSPDHVVHSYRVAFEVVTGVSGAGLLVVLGGLFSGRRDPANHRLPCCDVAS
jgi:hypothetical protein